MIYLYLGLTTLLYFTIWFIIAQIKKNNGLIDIAWGLGFVVLAWTAFFLNQSFSIIQVLLNILVTAWGLRLFFYLTRRNWNKPEDFRYVAMRNKWQTKLKTKAFFKVFLTQAIAQLIIAVPIILLNTIDIKEPDWLTNTYMITGLALFAIGFIFESIGDQQLATFKSIPENKGRVMKSGLWKYTRHPNYFGESMIWWAIGIISLSTLDVISFIGLISPITITYLLLFVTGVPLLKKRYSKNLEYQEYAKKTSTFIPWFPKK